MPAEVQLGGADVLSYAEMMRTYARVAGINDQPMSFEDAVRRALA